MFLVNLPPDLSRIQRIAVFEENVHILYMAEMARDSRFPAINVVSKSTRKMQDYQM
jgi:hypothetical protein